MLETVAIDRDAVPFVRGLMPLFTCFWDFQ
jgi:hypothetical protein